MPNPLDTLYDQLKGQYPDLVDRSEFIGKLSNDDELKKLHDAASKDIPGFVDFDNFKSKVGESLSTYDQDSDYKAQGAPAEQESAPTDITIPRREKGRHVPSEPQNGGISSEAYVPTEPGQPIDTRVEAEPFDRETGDLDELDRRYQEKVKRLEGYGREPSLYANEDEARKHYESYSKLYDEAEQDRLVYNRRVKAAEDERAEQQRQLDLQSKDRKTRRSAEYGGYTNDQVRKEQERLKKERAYLEDPKSRRNADYSKRVMEYNADQTALSGEADKRNKRAESKRAMYDEVREVAEDPDVQKRITGNDTVTYVLSGNNTYALQNYDTARERAKTMSDEELVEHCKSIAGQKYARGDNKDIYAPLAAAFMAYHNELMYRLGGDEPKSALEMRYDMIDKATESSPEGDNFMLTLRNYLDGTAGMGTANFENDQSERANIPQFAVVDNYNALVAQNEDENMTKVEQIARYPQQEGVTDENMAAAANDISYDKLLEQAFERFGNENLKAYITAYALRNGISIDEAARRVNQSIWDETIGKTLEGYRPKSGFEFFVRRIFSDNMFAKLGQLGLRARNGTLGTTDPFAMSSMALDEYAKDHPILETGAAVFNFAVMEGPIFSAYGKVASGLVGATERAIIGAATKTADKMAIDATARALGQSLMYRLAKGGATGALTGFQYGTMSGAIDQAYYDGNVDFGKVIANGGHMARDFAIMHGVGELFGVTGDAILRRGQRNLRNGQGVLRNRLETTSLHFLNNVAKTTTNASIVTGLYAAIDKPALERENKKIEAENKKIEAENARLPEDKQKPLKPLNQIASVEDTFYSSLRMFAGLDAVGMLRSAWSIGVRGQYERNKHVKVHFDKFDREALEKAFGKNPNSLLRQIVFGNVDGVPAKWFEIDPEAEAEIYKELGRELTPAEKEAYATYGFTELRKVILNKEIPWATRAKIVSVVTGRIVQEPPVARGTIEFVMDKSGTVAKRIIVKSLDMEGNVIQAREFDGQREFEAARSLYESLNDRGWRNNALLCGNLVIDAIEDKTYADTVDEMAREKGIAPDQFEQMVFGIKQKDITGEKVTYQERQLVDEFDKRHQQKQQAETELAGPNKLFEQVAREVFGAEWKRALNIPRKSWGEMSEAEKEFVNRYIERIGAMGVAERNKLMNSNPDWSRAAKEYEESVRRRMAEAERPAEAEPLPALEDEKVSVEVPAEERVEPVPEVIELEEEQGKGQPTQSAGPQDTPTPVEERPAEPEPVKEEAPAEEPAAEKPDTEGQQQAGTIGFEPVEQPTELERYDAERKAKAATITDADIEANREALGIPEGTALTDEARQIYAEDLAEDLMRYERFKRGESDEKARFHDYWESKFNPERPKLEKPVEKQEEPVEEEEFEEEEEEVTDADALIEQFDNLKGRSDLEKYRNALKVFAGDDEIMGILEDLEPHDITEWVSSFLGLDSGKGYSMLWESKTRGGTVIAKGFKEETGWSWNDVKGFAFMFDNKNGMSPRRVAEKIWEALPSGMKNQYSDVDVFNIMMDLFKSSSRKSDLTNYIRNNRMEQVRELLNRRRSEELAEIARYKERMSRGEEEPIPEPVTPDDSSDEFAVREDEVAPFSLLSLNYRDGEAEGGTVRSRARTRKQIGTIAKALGYKIRWVADKPYNAKIDTDEKVLYLNIRTDQPLAAVMGHEVTHDLRKSDPEAYETLKRYAKDLLGQEQWDSEVADVTETYNKEYERRGWQPIRSEKAEEEVVCDTMGKVLHTKKGLRELAGSLDTTVAGKVYRLLKDITDKVKNALGKEQDYSVMDSALQEFLESVEQRAKNTQEANKQGIHLDPSGGYSVTDKADIESLAPRMEGESEAAYTERIGEIEADEKAFVDGDGQFSLKKEDDMRDNSVKYFEEYHVRGNKDRKYGPLRRNSITRQALDKANEMIAEMRDYIAPWYNREAGGNRYLPEEVYGLSTIFDNASYGATLENTLICTRTLAYNDFCDNVKRKLGRPLTKRESFLASQMLYDIATDPQCLYCYVSLDRKAYDEYLLRYFDERDAVIERYNKMSDKSAENIDALYKTFLDGRKDTYQMRSRFNSWLMLADHDSAIGRDKVALSADRKNALAQESNEEAAVRWRDITKQYNRLRGEEKKKFKESKEYLDALHAYLTTEQGQIKDACAYAQGASWAKKEAEYRSYTGELLRTTKRMLGGLASHYGLRFYSFSEYSPAFILENMQMIRDAALRGLKGFAYTKEIDFCKIFLPTGININCSTYGRRNAAGEIVMDERQGANWDEARALRDQYENMGIVFVATDDEMVRWAKEQPWIDVIIPFHIVRTGADIAEFYGWTNYTNVSADYDAQGRHKDIMPPEHNNSIEDYDRLIAERGLTRRFPQFYDGPGDQNYMKLINETRRKASDTPILTPVFNMEEAKKSFDKFVEKGGYWGGFYEVGADDVVRAVDEVAADIEAGKSAGEVEYGRQDIDFDSAMANLEKTRRRINRNREHGNTPKTSFSLKREGRDEERKLNEPWRDMGEVFDEQEERITDMLGRTTGRLHEDISIAWEAIKTIYGKKSLASDEDLLFIKMDLDDLEHIVDGDIKKMRAKLYHYNFDSKSRRYRQLREVDVLYKYIADITKDRLKELTKGINTMRSWKVKSTQKVTLDDLDALFKEHNKDDYNGELWDRVLAVSRKFGIENIKFKDLAFGHRGEQFGGRIRFDKYTMNDPFLDDAEKCQVLLHEMIHHVTAHVFDYGKEYLSEQEQRAARELHDVFDIISEDESFKEFYGASKNVKEMIAELSNPEFREALKKKNLWGRIIDGIMRLFGFEQEGDERTTAYSKVRDALEIILETGNKEAYDADANRKYVYNRNFMTGDEVTSFSLKARRMEEDKPSDHRARRERPYDLYRSDSPAAELMVSLLKPNKGDRILEPSAGKGDIIDFVGEDNPVTAVEINPLLIPALKEKVGNGEIINEDFLNHDGERKYPRIVMNPPFGDGGKLAIQHTEAAFAHLEDGGRLVAIIPSGKEATALFNEMMGRIEQQGAHLAMRIDMPSSLFNKQNARLKTSVVVIDRNGESGEPVIEDLSSIKDKDELYNRFDDISRQYGSGLNLDNGQFSLKRDDRNAPTFYSNAAKAVENVKQNKATAEQWKAMLTKQGGIKAGEDKWMGLSQWLDDHKGQTLTKEEVAQFVADNGIEMEEEANVASNEVRKKYTTEGLTNKREISFRTPDAMDYQQDDEIHFYGATMWVRFGETTDKNGNRVLVIDEIQSNRHQNGRRKGYSDTPAGNEWNKFRKALRKKYGEWNIRTISKEEADRLNDLLSKRNQEAGYIERHKEVPIAPFEKNWHEVAMKRMLRLAAEEGYDKVAWTTGEQQAKRNNQIKVLKEIVVTGDFGNYGIGPLVKHIRLEFTNNYGKSVYVDQDGILWTEYGRGSQLHGKRLSDVIGEDLAKRVLSNKGRRTIKAGNIRVGGEGMKDFYDKMLPQFMNKYGKRWGVKVGAVELPNVEKSGRIMHSVDVTPEMRRSVMENGQPLFSLKREDSQKVFDTAKRKFGETKDIREAGYVLPDGVMLDFSGRHELDPGTDSSFLAGRRTTDHRAVNQISFVYDENGDEVDTGVSSDMSDFIKRGAIRIDNNAGSINLSAAPTMAQRKVLRELIRRNGGDVQVDFGDGWNSDHYVEYEEASAQRVLGDIDRYFDEGIKPEGNMRFSLKRETRTDADGNEVYTETREDGTKDREITTYGDGSKKALWYDDAGVLKERLDYYPDGEVRQVANYDYAGELTRHIQYDENRRITSYYLPAIGTDWRIDENGVISGKSNGVEIKPYNFQFSLKREQTHSENFKQWFGDWENDPENASKVVDEEGKPLVVYRGGEKINIFEPDKASRMAMYGPAFYATPSYVDAQEFGKGRTGNADDVQAVYLDIRNPWVDGPCESLGYPKEATMEQARELVDLLTSKGLVDGGIILAKWNDGRVRSLLGALADAEYEGVERGRGEWWHASDIVQDALKELGYDGVIGRFDSGDGHMVEQVAAFEPTQIKSATDNNGDFSRENPDIRFSLKRRRNRDDYTDEDRADAAIIANTYLAQADALRQQIEADREREHQLVEERNRLLAFDYPAANPADRPAIMDHINDLRNQINDLRNANYENNTKLRSMDYEYRVAKEILEQGAVTDEEAARFDAGQMTREEKVLESLFKAAADSRADKKAKQKAIRGLVRELTAINDNFKAAMKARGIESQRKRYDKGTVDHIIRLAKAMMGTGYIDNMTSYEVKRLMGMINNAATRESIEEQAGRIVDMMLDHQIRTLRNDFNKQLKVTGQKTNSSGVQVQAGLDQEGQVVMEAMRKSMQIIADSAGERYDSNGYLTEWGEFYEKTLNDMGDADPVKAEQARKIFEGVWLASKWYEDVRTMEINGRILRSQMEDFKASNKPARDADADTKKRYNDVLADYQEMLRQNKIKIIEAYERMTGDVGMTQADSMRRAKEFADAQKRRVEDIQHNANSDLEGVDDNTQVETPESRVFGANKNNVLARLLFASAGTYEKFMRFFGRMAPNGEGYLFKRFMTQYHHARQDYWKGRHSAFEEMDRKMAEVFGKKKMHWSDIYEMTRDHKKFPPITVSYWDGYRNGQPFLRVDELNQSEALYLYMINKMPDGRMKLRHMGITDDVVQQMADQINDKLITLADWLQSEFLPKMRIKYNETHKRVFGADMAAIEDYFPLRINKLAVASDMDITERDMNDNKPSTITGAIVKRRVNTLPIDLHTDAFDVALSHIDEMEHWSAFAEFNRDNNTLVNYKRFRTKVNNMRSLELGAGNVLWKNFTDAVAIAADAYHPRAGSRSGDHYSTRVAKFVSTAKIALRPYTALKQLLSIPAFWADSDPLEQMKATVDVANTWQWAIENLPGFAERWQSRQAGNIKLANYNDLSGLRRRKTMRKLQRAGMWANAAIDGLACAMGGKAVYETKLKRYRKMGYDAARAQEKALIDAAIAYNNSQQSSEGAYVSPLQVDRTWFANAFSVFRSASMGYTRRLNTSLRQLRNATFKPGYGAQSVEFLKKQMMRDGLTEEQATKWAHRIYRRANLKAAASVAIFGQILPFAWNLGANMFYLLFGNDDKEKEGILADSFRHSFFGPIEGLTGGNVLSELGDIAADTAIGNIWGDTVWGDSEAYKMLGYRDFSTMPLSSDLRNLLKYFARDEVKAANEVVNILFQVATGVNPQTITDWTTAILDFSRSDMERRDIAMFAMRLLSTPQSQLDKFYLDQMNISQEQADKMSVDDLIKRYATYKRWRETPLTGWMYSDEREKKVEEKFQKRYEQMLEERSVAEDGLRGAINDIKDLPRKRTMMQKLQKELTDSIEAADPELYKKALEGEKADDDEYVRHVTDKDVEQMAELTMKKKALRAARDRKVQADKDTEAGRITQEEYDAIYEVCAHEWKLYNYLNNTLPKKLKEWKLKMEPDMQDKYTPEQVMDTIRSKTDKALQMRPEDMKLKKGDKKKVKKNKKK